MKNINGNVLEEQFIDEKTGKRCIIALNNFGYRLGYVEVDKSIPNEVYTDDMTLSRYLRDDSVEPVVVFSINMYNNRTNIKRKQGLYVHGGVTFVGNLRHLGIDIEKAVGFDCAHFNDAPDLNSVAKYYGKKSDEYKLIKSVSRKDEDRHIWSLEDVKAELKDLASQVLKTESIYKNRTKIERAKRWRKKKRNLGNQVRSK